MSKHISKAGAGPSPRKQSSVSVRENRCTFVVCVQGVRSPDVVHVDEESYATLLERRCDYAIKVFADEPKRAFFFVELKGEDVIKAAEQLTYTIEHLDSYKGMGIDYSPYSGRSACIVSTRGLCPAVSTRYQMFQRRIERCGFKLRCKTIQLSAMVAANGEITYS